MKRIRALRALGRIELRQLRHHLGRSLLLLVLVVVPVAAVVCGSNLAVITGQTPAEAKTRCMGRADLRIDDVNQYEDLQRVQRALPGAARTERIFVGAESVRIPGSRLRGRSFAVRPQALETDGLAEGWLRLTGGRWPANSAEVALSPALLQGLGRELGHTVTLDYGPVRTITGIVIDPESLDMPLLLRTPAAVEYRGQQHLLVSIPESSLASTVSALLTAGLSVQTRSSLQGEDGLAVTIVFAVGCLAFFEAGLVIASAFTVSLRRRQFEIGLLGSAGATVASITGAMLISAAVIAMMGGVIGALLGIVGAIIVHPYLDGWNQRLNGPFEVSAAYIATAIGLGITMAVCAAALPAWHAARIPVRVALGGRQPTKASSRIWLVAGVVCIALGMGLVFGASDDAGTGALAILGSLLTLLGLGACSPALLVGAMRCASRLPLSWRLGVRDAGRFRARNVPVVTAVLAGMAMSVTMAAFVASLVAALDGLPARYRDDQLLVQGADAARVAGQLAEQLPCVAHAPLRAVYAHGIPVRARIVDRPPGTRRGEWVACGGDDLLLALDVESAAVAFRGGRLLALNPPDGVSTAEVELTTWIGKHAIDSPSVEAVRLTQAITDPLFLMNESCLETHDLDSGPPLNETLVPWLVRLESPVTDDVLRRAQQVAAAAVGTSVDAAALHRPPIRRAYYAVFVVCLLTGLIVVLLATALSAAESVGDRRILHSVGASPRLIRSHTAARAGYLALLGCLLAVPAGLLPAVGLLNVTNFPMEFVIPWREIGLTVLGMPMIVYGLTWISGCFPSASLSS